jgi:phage protein D
MTTTAGIQRRIEIDGSELAADVDTQLESLVVVDRLTMPDMFTLVFRDPTVDILSRAGIEVGKTVTISAAPGRDDELRPLIHGEVTSIEADYDNLAMRAVVRGYDLSHRLAAGRRTQTYQNVKLSDVASQIAGEAGLQADVDDSGGTVDYVIQANQSNLEFLYAIARRIGFDCRVEEETLMFKRPTESTAAPGPGDTDRQAPDQLVWNVNLLEFRARMSAVGQVSEVQVRGWDVGAKAAVVGQADVSAASAGLSTSPADLADKVGGQTLVVVDHPVGSQETANELAVARAEQIGSAAFEATAVALGSPDLKAGTAVSVAGVDPSLEGQWVISGSRHEIGAGAYRTFLEFTGRQDRSLPGLFAGGMPGAPASGRIPGVVTGVVTDNDDPSAMCRVKVQLPWLSDEAESFWARVAAPGAGPDYGIVWIPQVGDEVLVAFEQGDVSYPVVLGGLWNGRDPVPAGFGDFDAGSVRQSGFVSRRGHQIVFHDADDDAGIEIQTAEGKFRIALSETDGELHIHFDGKLVVEGTGDIEFTTNGAYKVDARGGVELKGTTVAIN